MLDPMKKGPLSFHNTVSIRGYQNVNIMAAVYLIMFGPEHEGRFAKADLKGAGNGWNYMFMHDVEPIIARKDALREVYSTFIKDNPKAMEAFEATELFESSDKELQEILQELKNGVVREVPVIEEMATQEVEVPEVSTEEPVTSVGSVTEEPEVNTTVTEVMDYDSGETVPVEESNASFEETKEEPEYIHESVNDNNESDVSAPVISVPRYSADLVILEEGNEIEKALSGKLTKEVLDFKTIPNVVSAARVCEKLQSLLPGRALMDLIYDKDVIHVLYGEFQGAAYLLSSFRVLAMHLAAGGK